MALFGGGAVADHSSVSSVSFVISSKGFPSQSCCGVATLLRAAHAKVVSANLERNEPGTSNVIDFILCTLQDRKNSTCRTTTTTLQYVVQFVLSPVPKISKGGGKTNILN